jgi:pyruvate/2-oxoglutarate dehydrogenase complex dihydrolipoamide acyltransferase (E2) component
VPLPATRTSLLNASGLAHLQAQLLARLDDDESRLQLLRIAACDVRLLAGQARQLVRACIGGSSMVRIVTTSSSSSSIVKRSGSNSQPGTATATATAQAAATTATTATAAAAAAAAAATEAVTAVTASTAAAAAAARGGGLDAQQVGSLLLDMVPQFLRDGAQGLQLLADACLTDAAARRTVVARAGPAFSAFTDCVCGHYR